MIEIIISLFQQAGFSVFVAPGRLIIRKRLNQKTIGMDWAIAPEDLSYLSPSLLLDEAKSRIRQLESEIAPKW